MQVKIPIPIPKTKHRNTISKAVWSVIIDFSTIGYKLLQSLLMFDAFTEIKPKITSDLLFCCPDEATCLFGPVPVNHRNMSNDYTIVYSSSAYLKIIGWLCVSYFSFEWRRRFGRAELKIIFHNNIDKMSENRPIFKLYDGLELTFGLANLLTFWAT